MRVNHAVPPVASSRTTKAKPTVPTFGQQPRREDGVIYRLEPLAQTKNACGTTSLAMVLNALRVPVTPAELDARYRKYDNAYTSVRSILEAAREYGVKAEVYNRSTFEEVREHLDKKRLLIVASLDTNTRKYGANAHYVVLHGYALSPDGRHSVAITDPAGGRRYWQAFESLEAEWKDPRYFGMNVGFSNALIAFSKTEDLPPGRMGRLLSATDQVAYAGNQVLNAWADLKQGRVGLALRQTGRGLRLGLPALGRFTWHKLRSAQPE